MTQVLYTINDANSATAEEEIAGGLTTATHLLMVMKYGKDVDTLYDNIPDALSLGGRANPETGPEAAVFKITVERVAAQGATVQ